VSAILATVFHRRRTGAALFRSPARQRFRLLFSDGDWGGGLQGRWHGHFPGVRKPSASGMMPARQTSRFSPGRRAGFAWQYWRRGAAPETLIPAQPATARIGRPVAMVFHAPSAGRRDAWLKRFPAERTFRGKNMAFIQKDGMNRSQTPATTTHRGFDRLRPRFLCGNAFRCLEPRQWRTHQRPRNTA